MDIHTLIAEQVERLLASEVDPKRIAEAEAGVWPAALWEALEDMGLPLALVDESNGGTGLRWQDAGVVFSALGRHAAPVPLGETMIAAWALAASGQSIPEGPLTIAPAGFTVRDGRVHGVVDAVPWAQNAGHMVVADGPDVLLLPLDATAIVANRSVGRDPLGRVSCGGVAPLSRGTLPFGDAPLRLEASAATLRAVQSAGALSRVLAMCVEYANVRNQFGRPIAKFQAVQHMLAEMATETAAAQTAASIALRAADGPVLGAAPGVAKVRTAMAATRVAALAHAVHGAIGVTDEYALHHFTRRLWQWRGDYGSEHLWAERLGKAMLDAGSQALWRRIVTGR